MRKSRRIAVVGGRAVGKSALISRFLESTFTEAYAPTIEASLQKSLRVQGQEYDLTILDTAGQAWEPLKQDEYSLTTHGIGIDGYVLVYAVNSRSSFELIKTIREKLVYNVGSADGVPMIVVGTKSDLSNVRQVSTEEGRQLASAWNCKFIESSAKLSSNTSLTRLTLGNVFYTIIADIECHINPAPLPNKSCLLG